MESIVDFQKRLHKRHMTLNGTSTDVPTTKTGGSTIPTSIRGGVVSSEAPITAAKVRSPSHQPTTSRMPKPVAAVAKETPNKPNKAEPVVKMTKKLTMPSPLKVNNTISNNVLAPQSSNIPVFVSNVSYKFCPRLVISHKTNKI